MPRGWESDRLRLVPLDRERHFDNAGEWAKGPEVTAWTLIGDMPISKLAEEEFFARGMKPDPTQVHFAIELRDGDQHIGFTALHKVELAHGCATSGTLIGRRDLWGQGYGSESIALRSRYAFDVLGLRMVLSEVLDGNIASLRALVKNGYRETGRIRERFWKRGAYRDAIYLTLYGETWLAR